MATLGEWRVDVVEDGRFGLDGGAMFGIIPRPLWSRKNPPDDQNRIELGLRCLLLRRGETVLLVDTGMGERWPDSARAQFRIERDPVPGLIDNLAALGVAPEQVTDVLLTHLHFDHNGGTVRPDGQLTFPRAMHHAGRKQLARALAPSPKDAGSFRPEDRDGLVEGDNLKLYDAGDRLMDGIDLLGADGHTEGMLLPRLRAGGETIVFCADLLPTASHLHLPWVMGYDCMPVTSIAEKADLLEQAEAGGWILVYEHDPEIDASRVTRDARGRYARGEEVDLGGRPRSWN